MMINKYRFRKIFWFTFLSFNIFLLTSCLPLNNEEPLRLPFSETITRTVPSPIETNDELPALQSYTNETFGLSFNFPGDWYGPDIYEWDQGVRIEIGSDIVYPYGTGREDQVYNEEDAYYITIQFEHRPEGLANTAYLDILQLQDGESIETPRSLATREKTWEVSKFSGIEFTVTLSESAQTEIFYVREVVLFDEAMNFITITGSPNNVRILDSENWREYYMRIDKQYQDVFYTVVKSISTH